MESVRFGIIPGQKQFELVEYYNKHITFYQTAESRTRAWVMAHAQSDWIYLDCGANVGLYTLIFSKLSPDGTVYAFEPTETYDKLLTNITHNNCTNIRPFKMALGKESGKKTDKIYKIWGNPPDEAEYPFVSIDDFVNQNHLDRVDCIKIDVDSYDYEVLMGAEHTLAKYDPYIIVELNHALALRGFSNVQALEWLSRRGYSTALNLDYDNFILKRSECPDKQFSTSIVLQFPNDEGNMP